MVCNKNSCPKKDWCKNLEEDLEEIVQNIEEKKK